MLEDGHRGDEVEPLVRHGLERFAQVEIPDLHALRRQIVPELVEGPFVVARSTPKA